MNPRKSKVNEGKLGKMEVSKFEKVGHWMSAKKVGGHQSQEVGEHRMNVWKFGKIEPYEDGQKMKL